MFFLHFIPFFLYLYPKIIDKIGMGNHNQKNQVVETEEKPTALFWLSAAKSQVFIAPKKLIMVSINKNVIIGIYEKSLTKKGEYQALIGIELL